MPVHVGDVEIVALCDGEGAFPHTFAEFFPGVPEGSFDPWRAEHPGAFDADGPNGEAVPHGRWGAFLLRTPTAIVLVDTGFGTETGPYPPGGALLADLASHGLMPADIDLVVFSHLHPDHVGQTFDAHGEPVFEHAAYVCSAADWELFADPARAGDFPWIGPQPGRLAGPRADGSPFDLRLLPAAETEIAPGVFALPAPGHSPGHTALVIRSGGQEALLAGDAFFHPAQLEHPGWATESDGDPATATATRRALLERVLDRDVVLGACHFPAPGLGRVRRGAGGRVHWEGVA